MRASRAPAPGVTVRRRSLALVRLGARLPRIAVLVVCAFFAVLGLRVALAGSPAAIAPPPADPALRPHGEEDSLAEAFTRAYLSFDADRPEAHARAVAALAPDLEQGGGLVLPSAGSSHVSWTAPVAFARTDADRAIVTVALATGTGVDLRYLAVPVTRRAGALTVEDYPSFVGAPSRAPRRPEREEVEVADPALRAVAERFTANYLRGARQNAAADLAPGARLSLPRHPLVLDEVLGVTELPGGRIAVLLTASALEQDLGHTLRYELAVVRRDRWYVAAVNHPTSEGKGTP